MDVHARLKNEFTEDEKYHNLMSWRQCIAYCVLRKQQGRELSTRSCKTGLSNSPINILLSVPRWCFCCGSTMCLFVYFVRFMFACDNIGLFEISLMATFLEMGYLPGFPHTWCWRRFSMFLFLSRQNLKWILIVSVPTDVYSK